MKNFLQNNTKNNSLSASQVASFIVIMLVFQLCFPFLATATSEDVTEPVVEVEVVEPAPEEEMPEPAPEEEPVVATENTEEAEIPEIIEEETPAATENSGTASIVTGDAESGATIESEINTLEVDLTQASSTPDSEDEEPTPTATTTDTELPPVEEVASTTATGTLNVLREYNPTPEATSTDPTTSSTTPTYIETASSTAPIITITGTSTATSSTTVESTANTGGNGTTATEYFDIETGSAISYIDLVNVVNTNIIDSDGLIDFIRGSLGYENFDLRDAFADIFNDFTTAESTSICGQDVCDPSLLVDLTNQAIINNDINITANTGGNIGQGGSGEITTGNAYASANIVNLANTNIIDSNYLLLVFDNFDDLAGSLVLPNSDFFNSLQTNNQNTGGLFNFDNTADVTNNITTVANTGGNTATGTTNTSIETGNAVATSHTDNTINQNLLNTNSFSMLIRVQGTWSGDVFGLPEGMQWENTSDGIRLFYSNGKGVSSGASNVNITNDATINNNVQVYALTGDNEIDTENGGKINTGQAYADTTTVNIANTNVLGSNWINLIFNIYGDWSGNIAFGQPDLWLGLKTSTDTGTLRSGDDIEYTYTVFNRGDTTATNVTLENRFPYDAFGYMENMENGTTSPGYSSLPLGSIAAGETKEIVMHTTVNDTFGKTKQLPLPLTARVWGDQPDANDLDNEDTLLLYVGKKYKNKSGSPQQTFYSKFTIEKFADKAEAEAGDTVNYTVKFTNRGGPIFDSLLVDILTDEEGNTISEQTWPLDKIVNGETITITYSIILPDDVEDGIYTNTAQLLGMHGSIRKIDRTPFESITTEHKLNVGNGPEGQVLGLSTDMSCTPYLTTYMREYSRNDSAEVTKLQRFLQFNIDSKVAVTGIFDTATKQAVQKFQQQYTDEILTPWGMNQSSGYVYYTTQKKINEIMCGGAIDFPLTSHQESEISAFLNNTTEIIDNYDPDFGIDTPRQTPPLPEPDELTSETQTSPEDAQVSHRDTIISVPPALYDRVSNWVEIFQNKLTALR
jgi:uncharacterized repeat protein (TIGR01451 family)